MGPTSNAELQLLGKDTTQLFDNLTADFNKIDSSSSVFFTYLHSYISSICDGILGRVELFNASKALYSVVGPAGNSWTPASLKAFANCDAELLGADTRIVLALKHDVERIQREFRALLSSLKDQFAVRHRKLKECTQLFEKRDAKKVSSDASREKKRAKKFETKIKPLRIDLQTLTDALIVSLGDFKRTYLDWFEPLLDAVVRMRLHVPEQTSDEYLRDRTLQQFRNDVAVAETKLTDAFRQLSSPEVSWTSLSQDMALMVRFPLSVTYFKQFAEEERVPESFGFYQDVQTWKALWKNGVPAAEAEVAHGARSIVTTYLQEGASQEINVPQALKLVALKNYKEKLSVGMFDKPLDAISDMLEECFQHFKTSSHAKALQDRLARIKTLHMKLQTTTHRIPTLGGDIDQEHGCTSEADEEYDSGSSQHSGTTTGTSNDSEARRSSRGRAGSDVTQRNRMTVMKRSSSSSLIVLPETLEKSRGATPTLVGSGKSSTAPLPPVTTAVNVPNTKNYSLSTHLLDSSTTPQHSPITGSSVLSALSVDSPVSLSPSSSMSLTPGSPSFLRDTSPNGTMRPSTKSHSTELNLSPTVMARSTSTYNLNRGMKSIAAALSGIVLSGASYHHSKTGSKGNRRPSDEYDSDSSNSSTHTSSSMHLPIDVTPAGTRQLTLLSSHLGELVNSPFGADFMIHCGPENVPFYCHSLIFSVRWPIFMREHPVVPTPQNNELPSPSSKNGSPQPQHTVNPHDHIIVLSTVDPEIFSLALEYIYTGSLNIQDISERKLSLLTDFARYRKVPGLKDYTNSQQLSRQPTARVVNAIMAYVQSSAASGEMLRLENDAKYEAFMSALAARAQELVDLSLFDFHQLQRLRRIDMIHLIRRDDFSVASEASIFKLVTTWADRASADQDTLVENISFLMAHVRLPLMTAEELRWVDSLGFVPQNLMKEAFKYKETGVCHHHTRAKPRRPSVTSESRANSPSLPSSPSSVLLQFENVSTRLAALINNRPSNSPPQNHVRAVKPAPTLSSFSSLESFDASDSEDDGTLFRKKSNAHKSSSTEKIEYISKDKDKKGKKPAAAESALPSPLKRAHSTGTGSGTAIDNYISNKKASKSKTKEKISPAGSPTGHAPAPLLGRG